MTVRLTEDQAHVLLDAITIAHHQAHATNFRPWNDYTVDDYDDDKATSAGWYELLGEAREALGEFLNRGGDNGPYRCPLRHPHPPVSDTVCCPGEPSGVA